MKEFKVVILGPGGVGKSALTVQFISGKFVERYDPTVEDFYRKEIEVDGDPAMLEILDTAGTEQFASMRDLYIKNGQGFVIVYSLTSKQSFEDIKLIREQIVRVKGTNRVPIVLAANKCDIRQQQREVASEEGLALAAEWNTPYVETSAKNSPIVNSLFTEIVKEMNLIRNRDSSSHSRKDKRRFKKLSAKLSSSKAAASGGLFSTSSSLKTDSTLNNASSSTSAACIAHKKTSYFNWHRFKGCFNECCACGESREDDDVYTKNSKCNASNNNIVSNNNDSFNDAKHRMCAIL